MTINLKELAAWKPIYARNIRELAQSIIVCTSDKGREIRFDTATVDQVRLVWELANRLAEETLGIPAKIPPPHLGDY